ncbi:MAG: hypothetical protein HYR88_09285, partial [Verrucomicrobia bacterium]|nr:hypothetical protein [Verrucomicrobiota bacterium]
MSPPQCSRRGMLKRCGAGFGHLALLPLLGGAASGALASPLAAQAPRFPGRAKRVIFL